MSAPSRTASAPNLNKFSQHRNGQRYTILGKRKVLSCEMEEDKPAANKYDVREMVTKTSKFRAFTTTKFSTASRWPREYESVTAGPGMYNTNKSTLGKKDVGFAKSLRPSLESQIGVGKNNTGPGQYEVRGKNRYGDPTLSQITCKQLGRHGWYYDNKE